MIPYAAQLQKHQFNIRKVRSHHKNGTDKFYCDDIFTFDIETTSAWINEYGNVIKYKPGKSADYWNGLQAVALCYIWQFSVNDVVYYGRELRDFIHVIEDLPDDAKVFIWVHNLSFEFAFLANIFPDGCEVFARAPHKPMYFRPKKYPNIEFRCTYMLTRLSLDAWGKSLGVPKCPPIDYEKIRTPKTELPPDLMKYAGQDCRVVYAGIKDYLKRYHTQDKIPLTQTGTVRREVKNRLCIYPEYIKAIKKLCPKDAAEYKLLQTVFAGGYTHANRLHSGRVQTGLITHFDFASSYPTVMVCEKYPCTPWVYIGHKIPPVETFDEKAYIFKLRFYNIECFTYNTYIQSYKCYTKNEVSDNGRVISADLLEITITEQDFLTIQDTYTWKKVEVLAAYESVKDYLPTIFVEYILELYRNKTSLKNVKGKEDLYMQSKQYINSLFGMMVTAICQSEILLNDGYEWESQTLTAEIVNQKLQSIRDGWKRDKRYFLSYSWGCWVTATARRRLWKCLLGRRVSKYKWENDERVLYADTDSLFILGEADFSEYNKSVIRDLERACEHHGISPDKIRPKTPDGIEKPLGIFDREENCTEFVTLGAKRYCERREDGKLYLTVSGINKNAVYILHDDINNFRDGLNFDKDFPTVKKQLLTYLDDMPPVVFPDGYRSEYKYGINLRRTGYNLSMTDEYKNLIRYEAANVSALSDEYKNHERGRFL